ncbi:MAG TPA: hypothetical protein ENJ77_01380, partial [Candidatus Moranbacteria bacterium]|nr:hypothetical protein [Candidatus Moranbacteria bacterium]
DADLNRLFLPESLLTEKQKKSYEYQRVKILRKYLDRADALLDLHTSSVKGTPPFVICEDNAEEIACFLPANLLVSGFDRLEPGGTDWYMNKRGNIGICLECGHSADSESAKTAARGIFAFLKLRGHIDGGHLRRREQLQIEVYRKHISRRSFFPAKNFKNFQRVEKGELIGRDGDEVIKASRESLILFAHTCREKGQDAFLLAKKKKPRQV